MEQENPPYTSITRGCGSRWAAVLLRYNVIHDQYLIEEIRPGRETKIGAEMEAKEWAAEKGLEYR